MGTSWAKIVVLVWPYTSLDEHTSGIIERGMSNIASSSSFQSRVSMSSSIVREAFETSVTCLAARELPHQPRVDSTEPKPAGLGPLARTLDVVEYPLDLRGAGNRRRR